MTQAELLHSELREMIQNPDYYTEEESLNHLDLLVKEIVKNPSHGQNIIDDYDQNKIEDDLCPECNEPLENIPHKQYSECRGTNTYEITYNQQCPNCGWDRDKN